MIVQKRYLIRLLILVICCCSFISCTSDIDVSEDGNDNPLESNESQDDEKGELTQEDNLLQNGSFEKWMVGMPKSFYYNNYSVRRSKIAYEGNYSVRMVAAKGETAKLYQRIKLTPGSRIRICFHYYIEEGKNNGARTYCYFRTTPSENIPNAVLNDIYDKDTLKIIRGGGYGISYLPLLIGEWQTFDYVIDVPPTANYFVFEIHSYYGTAICIDDCYVIEIF